MSPVASSWQIRINFAGQEKEAVEQWEEVYRVSADKSSVTQIQSAFQRSGYSAVGEWRFLHQKALAHRYYHSPFWLALQAGRARHRGETLSLLEDAYRERSPRLVFLPNEPIFDFIHAEPRYQAIVRSMNLPVSP